MNGGHSDGTNGMASGSGGATISHGIVSMQPQLPYQIKANPISVQQSLSPSHQQQKEQQQQPFPVASSSSSTHQPNTRIPSMTQNFNQISKTATNLLNDIYEKHLLSQTTFENVNAMNGFCVKGMAGKNGGCGNGVSAMMAARATDRPTPMKHGLGRVSGGATIVQHRSMRPEQDFNFNNLCHQESPSLAPTAVAATTVGQRATNHGQQIPPTATIVSANAAIVNQPKASFAHSKSPKAPRIVLRNVADGGGAATANVASCSGSHATTAFPVAATTISVSGAKHQAPTKAMVATDSKGNAITTVYAACADGNSFDVNYTHPAGRRETNVFYDSSDYGIRKQLNKANGDSHSGYNGKISVRGEPVGGNFYDESHGVKGDVSLATAVIVADGNRRTDTAATNKYECGSNNKINIMLETAQAMAAAAYFARSV